MFYRYTPLDCAYVAEQLEIAEVLMENGGLSVTRIMEIAATKIQAGFRGHLVRRYLEQQRLHLNSGNSSKKNGNICLFIIVFFNLVHKMKSLHLHLYMLHCLVSCSFI